MSRRGRAARLLVAASVSAVLATSACTGGGVRDDTTGGPTTSASPRADTTEGSAAAQGGATSSSPDGATAGTSPDQVPDNPASTVPAPEVTILTDERTATPLVSRPGWHVLAETGACMLSWRGTADPEAPTATAREASAVLLSQVVEADGGDPHGTARDVILPLASDGVTTQGVNGVVQDWTVDGPSGVVHVRGAARAVSVPTIDGGASGQSVVLALNCVGSLDEAAWKGLLDDVRVGLVAPLEDLGAWPS